MQFEITILGCGAATPTLRHLPTAQAINWNGQWMLLDAGEGVQLGLRQQRIPFQKIERIFISHMHGDHVLGLPGLIGSMNLLGRRRPLVIYGPSSLESYVMTALKLTQTHLKFDLNFVAANPKGMHVSMQEKGARISSFPVKHRIEAYGYQFHFEAPELNVRKDQIEALELQRSEIIQLKKGRDVQRTDGIWIKCALACHTKAAPLCYVYSGDTRPCDAVLTASLNADLLYHEATFLDDKRSKAKETGHSTAKQAAQIAADANVKKLVIGHFSSRYRNEELLADEARVIFNNVVLANEGMKFQL
ncbi:ribonuclease Z [Flavobacteriales bacterium]|nr:ribonuclease Z [Flavobacteriales bacterium]